MDLTIVVKQMLKAKGYRLQQFNLSTIAADGTYAPGEIIIEANEERVPLSGLKNPTIWIIDNIVPVTTQDDTYLRYILKPAPNKRRDAFRNEMLKEFLDEELDALFKWVGDLPPIQLPLIGGGAKMPRSTRNINESLQDCKRNHRRSKRTKAPV